MKNRPDWTLPTLVIATIAVAFVVLFHMSVAPAAKADPVERLVDGYESRITPAKAQHFEQATRWRAYRAGEATAE